MKPGRTEGRGWSCHYQLRQLALALQLYAADHGCLPPPYLTGPDGKPTHSWRVFILPYIDEKDLYDSYSFAEAWVGLNNSLLAQTAPSLFQCPSDVTGTPGTTSYFAVVGPETAWPSAGGRRLEELTDGPEQTLLLIEAVGRGVNWLDPRDISYDEAVWLLTTGNAQDARAPHFLIDRFELSRPARNIVLADGSALLSRIGWRKDAAQAVLSVAGGEDVAGWVARQRAAQWPGPTRLGILTFGIVALVPLPWAIRRSRHGRASTIGPPATRNSRGAVEAL